MCQKSNVKNTSILLRMLLIAGLVISPLYPSVAAGSGPAMTMSGTDTDAASLGAEAEHATSPCHDGKMDCDTGCPCMAACMALSVQCLPCIASTVVRVVVVGQRFAIDSEAQLAS